MTAQQIASYWLTGPKTPDRVVKLRLLCERSKIPFDAVIQAIPEGKRP